MHTGSPYCTLLYPTVPSFCSFAGVTWQGRAQFANWIERLHESPGTLPMPSSIEDLK